MIDKCAVSFESTLVLLRQGRVCDMLCVCDLRRRSGVAERHFVKLHGSRLLVCGLNQVYIRVHVIVLERRQAQFDLTLKHSVEGALLEALLLPCTPMERQGTGPFSSSGCANFNCDMIGFGFAAPKFCVVPGGVPLSPPFFLHIYWQGLISAIMNAANISVGMAGRRAPTGNTGGVTLNLCLLMAAAPK